MRKALLAAMAVAAGLSLAACSSSGGDSGSGGSNAPVTITFWNSFTSSDRPAVEALVKKFNDENPDVKVDMTIMAGDVLNQKLLPAYQANQGPTIVAMDASQVPSFASKKVIQPVDDVYGDGGLDASKMPKASLDATTWDGKQYGVPFSASSTMLYYNKALLAKAGIAGPPATFDALVADAKKMTEYKDGGEATNVYGFAIPDSAAVATWAVLLEAYGGGIVSDDNSKSTFGDDATIKAMDYWAGLIQNDHISPVGLTGVDGDNLFNAGRVGYYINGPWATAGFKAAGIDYGIAPIPAGPSTQTATAISENMHLAAKATDAQAAAAKKFFAFWNSPESQTYWSVQTSYPPNTTDVTDSAIAANPNAVAFRKAVGAKFYLAGLLNAGKIDSDVVQPTWQKVTYGQGTAQDLLPPASDQIDALLNN